MKGLDMKKATKQIEPVRRRWYKKYSWYDFITPFLGFKWGAEVTLVIYGWMSKHPGLEAAAIIVAVFLFLEWCQVAWCEFKRREQK